MEVPPPWNQIGVVVAFVVVPLKLVVEVKGKPMEFVMVREPPKRKREAESSEMPEPAITVPVATDW
jgi:hypothetical protein